MCSPIVCGSKSVSFGFRHLRLTWASGKKATRPCPCGYLGHYSNRCRCTPDQIQRYRSRISGPLLDRIDLQIEVPAVPVEALARPRESERSNAIRSRVEAARGRMIERQGKANVKLLSADMETHCAIDAPAATILQQAIVKLGLSARAYHRVLKVARTIADLAEAPGKIMTSHVAEAVQYRLSDQPH
jgi:magnesium chelatase family protein